MIFKVANSYSSCSRQENYLRDQKEISYKIQKFSHRLYGSFVCGLQTLGDLHSLQMVFIFLAVQRSNKRKGLTTQKG